MGAERPVGCTIGLSGPALASLLTPT